MTSEHGVGAQTKAEHLGLLNVNQHLNLAPAIALTVVGATNVSLLLTRHIIHQRVAFQSSAGSLPYLTTSVAVGGNLRLGDGMLC